MDLPTTGTGDDFRGLSMRFNISLTGLTILFRIYTPGGTLAATYTTSDNLLIDPGNDQRLSIKQHAVTLPPNTYLCKLKMNPQGIKRTIMTFNWIITE
jgi:hypothetical protein